MGASVLSVLQGAFGQAGVPGPPGPQGAAVSDYFDLGSIIPAKAHANDLIFTGLVFLKPRSGSICSPQSDKNTEGRGQVGVLA